MKPFRTANALGYYSSDDDEDSTVYKNKQQVKTVPVTLEYYVGKWYQVYASLGPLVTFELGGRNTTAEYGFTETQGVLSVYNRNEPSLLPPQDIRGWAKASKTTPGVFSVTLGVSAASTSDRAKFTEPGNYWVIGLGPLVNNLYDWAVVTNSTKSQLYILCRNPRRFHDHYEKAVLYMVKNMGFTSTWSAPRKTEHTHM